jgi:hypothetical protein
MWEECHGLWDGVSEVLRDVQVGDLNRWEMWEEWEELLGEQVWGLL